MDPPVLESTPTELEIPRTIKRSDFIGYGEWNDIRRAVIEQNVPAGTQFVQYKNRVVPLHWEPLPMVSVVLPFGTVDETVDYIKSQAPRYVGWETSSDAGITALSNVPTSSADNHSPEDSPPGVESAISTLRIDCAETFEGVEALSNAATTAQPNVSTGSEEYYLAEDTLANAEEDTSSGEESVISNLYDTEQSSDGETLDLDHFVMTSEELMECGNNVLGGLLERKAEEQNLREDNGDDQDITKDSLPQKSELDAISNSQVEAFCRAGPSDGADDETEEIHNQQSQDQLSMMRELEIAEKRDRSPNDEVYTASVSKECGIAERRSDEGVSGSTYTSDRSFVGSGTPAGNAAPVAKDKIRKQKELMKEKREDRMMGQRSAAKPNVVICKPFPVNLSDLKDWGNILEAMERENFRRSADSFYFEGRRVPVKWKEVFYDRSKVDCIPGGIDGLVAGDPLTAGGSRTADCTLKEKIRSRRKRR